MEGCAKENEAMFNLNLKLQCCNKACEVIPQWYIGFKKKDVYAMLIPKMALS